MDTLPNSCKDATSVKSFKLNLKGAFLKTVLHIMQNIYLKSRVLLTTIDAFAAAKIRIN